MMKVRKTLDTTLGYQARDWLLRRHKLQIHSRHEKSGARLSAAFNIFRKGLGRCRGICLSPL